MKMDINLCYTILFITTHSLLATKKAKEIFSWFSLTPLHRSVYNLVTAVSLKVGKVVVE